MISIACCAVNVFICVVSSTLANFSHLTYSEQFEFLQVHLQFVCALFLVSGWYVLLNLAIFLCPVQCSALLSLISVIFQFVSSISVNRCETAAVESAL